MTVLDLTKGAGRYCTMILADMGAEVIKVEEAPKARFPRSVQAETETKSAAYDSTERNKKAIALNLKRKEAQDIFHKLAERADVVIEEFRPGMTEILGIDYNTLRRINPGIVYCSISGYGQTGRNRRQPGHDPNYEAVAGVLGITRTSTGQHALPGLPIADVAGGSLQATIGILLSIIARQKYGVGQFIDISMTDGVFSVMAWRYGADYLATGLQPKPGERPAHVYRTKDSKYISICPAEPWMWEKLCRALGTEQFIPYAMEGMAMRATTHYDEQAQQKRREIVSAFRKVFRTKTRDEWLDLLIGADTCVAPVNSFKDAFSSPQVVDREMVVELKHPTLGPVKQVGIPIKLSETPGKIRSFAPLYGEHTYQVLKELGYEAEQIENLREQGVISCAQFVEPRDPSRAEGSRA
ncbi:MAG: CoA transferase [Chloroflexi bacterium]|nr:CoA transferase [Chloroflexota bacterium]